MIRNKYSSGAIAISMLLIVVLGLFRQEQLWSRAIGWDVFGYYLYLPALFIYNDIGINDLDWFQKLFEVYAPSQSMYQLNHLETGGHAIRYPIGLAMLWIPFFVAGHIIAGLTGAVQDGMSAPYHGSLVVSSWIHLLVGLHWSRKTLRHFFPDPIVAVTLLLLLLGSNLLYMAVYDPLMPHVVLFTLYSGVIWHTIKWHSSYDPKHIRITGLLIGIAAVTRATDLILIMIPLLWGRWSLSPREHLARLRPHRRQLLVAGCIMLLPFIPQLVYWKIVTGHFFYDGYKNAGEGLDLHRPHLLELLFSFRKGFFIYTPLMALALAGCAILYKRYRAIAFAVIAFLIVYFWVVSSWTIWWYADSFGNRGLVQSYAVIMLPLAALVAWSAERRRSVLIGMVLIATSLVVLNLFQTWQTSQGILHSSRMTHEAYFKVFGKTDVPADLENALIVERGYDGTIPRMDPDRYRSIAVLEQDFDTPDSVWWTDRYVKEPFNSGPGSFRMDGEVPWSPALGVPYGSVTKKDHLYAYYSVALFVPYNVERPELVIVLGMEHNGKQYAVVEQKIQPSELISGEWNRIELWYVTPPIRHPRDPIRGFVWSLNSAEVWVDDARMELFEPIDRNQQLQYP